MADKPFFYACKRCVAGFFLGGYSIFLNAFPADSLNIPSRSLEEISVSASVLSKEQLSATPTKTIKTKEIEALGLRDLGDALRRFAGSNVKDYGGMGGMKTVSVRNMGASHTAVSYDGIAVSNCQAGQIDVGRFALENLEELSLSVGQPDQLLQSARLFASAAVLSLQTLKPTFKNGQQHTLTTRCKAGSFGEVNPVIRYATNIRQRTILSGDINYLRADGRYPFILQNGKLTGTRYRNNSDIGQVHGELNWYHDNPNNSTLQVKTYGFYSERGLPGSVTLYNEESKERLWDKNYFIQATYHKKFAFPWMLLIQGKYNYNQNKYQDEDSSYENGKITDLNTQQEGYFSASTQYSPSRNWNFSLAQDGALNTLRSNLKNNPLPNRYTLLTALNARYHSEYWKITATLVNTFVTEEVKQGTSPDNIHHLSPSLSATYTLPGEMPLRIRAFYKNTFRVPTFNDLYYRRLGNLDLKPEDAQEFNLGCTYTYTHTHLLKNISLSLDGYYNKVKNKIVAIPTAYVWRMQNHGEVNMGGLDATCMSTWEFSQNVSCDISCNYTWQRAIDITDPKAKNYKQQLPYTPKHSGNAAVMLRTPWVDLSYTFIAMSERYESKQNIPANLIKGFTEHSATASRTFLIKESKLTVICSMLNFTNEQYDVVRYYPMPGRSYKVTLKYEL